MKTVDPSLVVKKLAWYYPESRLAGLVSVRILRLVDREVDVPVLRVISPIWRPLDDEAMWGPE